MKYLMYLVKETNSSWDIEDHHWELQCEKPSHGEYKMVSVEEIHDCVDLDELG